MFYIPTKYKEIWRTLLIFHPSHPSHPIPSVNSALRASLCKCWAAGPRRDIVGILVHLHHFLYILLCLRKGILTFIFSGGNPPFWNLENVLSPEGTLRSRTQWGPFWFFPFYCVWERVFGPLFSGAVIRLFEILKMFYLRMGWMDGISKVIFKFHYTEKGCFWT